MIGTRENVCCKRNFLANSNSSNDNKENQLNSTVTETKRNKKRAKHAQLTGILIIFRVLARSIAQIGETLAFCLFESLLFGRGHSGAFPNDGMTRRVSPRIVRLDFTVLKKGKQRLSSKLDET